MMRSFTTLLPWLFYASINPANGTPFTLDTGPFCNRPHTMLNYYIILYTRIILCL